MRTRLLLIIPLISALVACNRQRVDVADNEGEIAIALSSTKAVPEEFQDYIITIRENDMTGKVVVSSPLHEFSNGCYRVPEGRYCVVADNVDVSEVMTGAGACHITGNTIVDVLPRTTSIAEINAEVVNAAVELIFDQSIKTAFKEFHITLSTDMKSCTAPEDGMVSWWMPGTVGIVITATLQDGNIITSNSSVDLAAKDYKRLTFSIDLIGKLQVDVTADDARDEEGSSVVINPVVGRQCGSILLAMTANGIRITDTKAAVDVDINKVEFTISGMDVYGQKYENNPISFQLGYVVFPVGHYTLTAFYQPDGENGASFAGVSEEFEVIAAGSTTATVDMRITNSSVTVVFDDSLIPYYGTNVVVSFIAPRVADTSGGQTVFFFAPDSAVSYKVSAQALPDSGAVSFESEIKTIVVPAHTNHTITVSAAPVGGTKASCPDVVLSLQEDWE